MVEVLHLISGPGDLQARRGSELLCRALGEEFPATCRTIGRGGDYRHVAHAALCLRAGWGSQVELIHAWDVPSFVAGLSAALPTVFSPGVPLTSGVARWLRLAAPRHSVHVVASTAAERAAWLRWGAQPARCHVIPPAVAQIHPRECRQQLREQLGFASDEYFVLAPGESGRACEHCRAVWAVSILHVLDERFRVLLWGRGDGLQAATKLARRLGQRKLLILAERHLGRAIDFEGLIGAADAALVAARGDLPVLPVLSCVAAGLPLVAVHSPITAELLGPSGGERLVRGGAPRQLARAILRLRDEPDQARSLAAAAAADAHIRFSRERFVGRMREVYWAAAMSGGKPPPAHRGSAEARPLINEGY